MLSAIGTGSPADPQLLRIKRFRKQTPPPKNEKMPWCRKKGLGVTIDETLTLSRLFEVQSCDVNALLISYFTLDKIEKMRLSGRK